MDYEKKYKEALERAKSFELPEYKNIMASVFPELQESEDERIRKEIIDVIRHSVNSMPADSFNERIAWLEKQNHDGKKWIYEDVYLKEKEQLIQDGIDEVLENPQKYGLEKQGKQKQWPHVEPLSEEDKLHLMPDEQKPADMVEPKFHEGDFIVNIVNKNAYIVVDVCDFIEKEYRLRRLSDNGFVQASVNVVDKQSRLWDITKDAKNGDVLVYCNEISIYKDIVKTCTENDTKFGGFTYYCCYDGNFLLNSLYSLTSKDEENIHPATKEQRDTLMEAMADAGYAFDFEKKELKELKKREQNSIEPDNLIEESYQQQADDLIDAVTEKPAWSEEDEKVLHAIRNALNYEKPRNYLKSRDFEFTDILDWLKSLKDRAQSQPKQEWSEEDESILQGIWDEILANKHDAKEYEWKTYDKFLNWLKSLKPQSTWKPSDEQMEILQYLCETSSHPNEKVIPTLKSLYQDLKKLKG